ncbi:MAG: hypothetical protein AAB946_02720 [Patescibacteria group bacterium]
MAVSGMGANQGIDFGSVLSQNKIEVIETTKNELTVEEYIKKYFSDIPVLVEVARCESRFRQHSRNGQVLQGLINEFDLGVMQINEKYHIEKADKLGFDLDTLEGNTAYARYLFEKKGLQPWISSAKCWKQTKAYADYRTTLALNR